jgi:prepilin-type processing-associated H-X9-DG protein
MYLNSSVRKRDVTDGVAHTIYVGEKPVELDGNGWISGTRATLRNTGSPVNANVAAQRSYGTGRDMGVGGYRAATGGGDAMLAVGGFGSRHEGGSNFLFGDGRVVLLAEDVDQAVYRQLGHRADGKLLETRDFLAF